MNSGVLLRLKMMRSIQLCKVRGSSEHDDMNSADVCSSAWQWPPKLQDDGILLPLENRVRSFRSVKTGPRHCPRNSPGLGSLLPGMNSLQLLRPPTT